MPNFAFRVERSPIFPLGVIHPRRKQNGIGLLLAFVVLILVASYAFLSYLSSNTAKFDRERQAGLILNTAKEALIAYSNIATAGVSQRPGNLLAPDGFDVTETPKNYDGNTDTVCFDVSQPNGMPMVWDNANARCIGRLPWHTLGMTYPAPSENDTIGVMPWYAVSANLALPGCVAYLNSEVLALSYTGFVCPGAGMPPTSLPYPWLTVRDAKGDVLSDRVAFVVMLPGAAINGQARPEPPNLSGANQYLDSVTINTTSVGCPAPPCVFSNADFDNDFIAGPISETFNDRLVFVTIDELMAKVEARVGQEIKVALQRFSQNYSPPGKVNYPWLAPFANPDVASNFKSVPGTGVGLLPTHAIGISFSTDFTWSVANGTIFQSGTVTRNMVRNTTALSVINGTCTWTSAGEKSVDCKGTILSPNPLLPPGVTSRLLEITYPTTGNYTVTRTPATVTTVANRRVSRANGSLSICLATPNSCVKVTDFQDADLTDDSAIPDPTPPTQTGQGFITSGNGTLIVSQIRVYPDLPSWYVDNHWNQLVLGAVSEAFAPGGNGIACATTLGNRCLTSMLDGNLERTDIPFLAMMAGATLPTTAAKGSAQLRPSANRNDYFDSINNVDMAGVGLTFDRQSAPSASFNDQLVF